MLQKAVEYEKPYFDEEDEDDEYDFTENKDDLYETGSDGEDEFKMPIYYIGLDSRKSFPLKKRSKVLVSSRVTLQKCTCKEAIMVTESL